MDLKPGNSKTDSNGLFLSPFEMAGNQRVLPGEKKMERGEGQSTCFRRLKEIIKWKSDSLTGIEKAKVTRTHVESKLIQLVCLGAYSGNWSKGVYISDYVKTGPPVNKNPPVTIGGDFHLKCLRRKCESSDNDYQIKLQIWEISEQERYLNVSRAFLRIASGAVVFWSAKSESFASALKWKDAIKKTNSIVPVVFVVDNVTKHGTPVSWLGSGMLMDSREAMDEFCVEHGFIAWFEMRSRDWESGEKSVFGQAVSRLLDEAMKSQ